MFALGAWGMLEACLKPFSRRYLYGFGGIAIARNGVVASRFGVFYLEMMSSLPMLPTLAPRKGILAVDESTGTIGKCLSSIIVENVETNRWALRELLFTTPGALQHLSGVDKVTDELAATNGETTTQGLEGLAQYCQKYYEAGAWFAKWRAVLKIAPMSHLS
ncbi:Fructose-bisphosphate aldolase [Quillaja saponaria]|uniref:fructose-bisphosphate aldolase n=1 Tax=Quillaja saponaria TaxID=32244 RepID=A0AAD7Q7V8_QUISA|nr:Fructose-bisphosphate aldolase [Quillaja saponaria]